jgi:hypothetical protein
MMPPPIDLDEYLQRGAGEVSDGSDIIASEAPSNGSIGVADVLSRQHLKPPPPVGGNKMEGRPLQKFTPRRDFPVPSLLFKAMRLKYGDAFGRHALPDTPANCWALVYETGVMNDDGSSTSSASQQNLGQSHHPRVDDVSVGGDQVAEEVDAWTTPPAEDVKKEPLELPLNTFACTVGVKLSQANYYLKSIRSVHVFVEDLAKQAQQQSRDRATL